MQLLICGVPLTSHGPKTPNNDFQKIGEDSHLIVKRRDDIQDGVFDLTMENGRYVLWTRMSCV